MRSFRNWPRSPWFLWLLPDNYFAVRANFLGKISASKGLDILPGLMASQISVTPTSRDVIINEFEMPHCEQWNWCGGKGE